MFEFKISAGATDGSLREFKTQCSYHDNTRIGAAIATTLSSLDLPIEPDLLLAGFLSALSVEKRREVNYEKLYSLVKDYRLAFNK